MCGYVVPVVSDNAKVKIIYRILNTDYVIFFKI